VILTILLWALVLPGIDFHIVDVHVGGGEAGDGGAAGAGAGAGPPAGGE
jgi:hypothetical protein